MANNVLISPPRMLNVSMSPTAAKIVGLVEVKPVMAQEAPAVRLKVLSVARAVAMRRKRRDKRCCIHESIG